DLRMVERLEEIRLRSPPSPNYPGIALAGSLSVSAYALAFRDYGIDLEALDAPVAAESIQASAIREHLVAALDDWTWGELCQGWSARHLFRSREKIRANESRPTKTYERLRSVADLVDTNEWGKQIRDPAVNRDRLALEELAARPEVASLPPSTGL